MQNIKVVTGKIGLDDHFRGIIVVSDILRKAGMEVVYLGAGQRIDVVINTMMQEDADAVGLSFQCGGYVQIMGMFMKRLKELKMDHAAVFPSHSDIIHRSFCYPGIRIHRSLITSGTGKAMGGSCA